MKYAIFSDIHGNYEAFISVLEKAEEQEVDSLVFLGDIVGYGASPCECLALLKRNSDISLGGNHDYAIAGKTSTRYFNEYAKAAVLWTQGQLADADRKYLGSLPVMGKNDDMTYAHSSPFEPEHWHYVTNALDAKRNFEYFSGEICFLGHSHVPLILEKQADGTLAGIRDKKVCLKEGHRYIVNDGSVGQPRDGNPKASFCIFDTEERSIEIVRVDYDIETEQKKIVKSGLPRFLSERLSVGR
ncbi:MAG: metallophosphoesterase family protein [Nitrospinota bacterium]